MENEELINYLYENHVRGDLSIEDMAVDILNLIKGDLDSSIRVYIRFGEIPKDFQSKVYRSDQVIRNEGGVSVWDCVCANDVYYPILPENPNEHAIADYFRMLLSDKPVYLVTGTELFLKGADGEPLLMEDIKILKELNYKNRKGGNK